MGIKIPDRKASNKAPKGAVKPPHIFKLCAAIMGKQTVMIVPHLISVASNVAAMMLAMINNDSAKKNAYAIYFLTLRVRR